MNEICEYCGEPLELDLLDAWLETREFMLVTCCEGMHEAAQDALQDGCREPWIREIFERNGIDIRQIYADDGQLLADYGLELAEIDLKSAKEFIRRHHRHNPPPVSWRWGHAVFNGPDLVGVAMVGRPVARMLDGKTIVEVNRLCVDPGLAPALVWNACSMLYAAARREAKARGFERIITYTLESELGTSLKASGWIPAHKTRGGSWDRKSRRRRDRAPTCVKIRWESILVK